MNHPQPRPCEPLWSWSKQCSTPVIKTHLTPRLKSTSPERIDLIVSSSVRSDTCSDWSASVPLAHSQAECSPASEDACAPVTGCVAPAELVLCLFTRGHKYVVPTGLTFIVVRNSEHRIHKIHPSFCSIYKTRKSSIRHKPIFKDARIAVSQLRLRRTLIVIARLLSKVLIGTTLALQKTAAT